jgi:hypothetical protein
MKRFIFITVLFFVSLLSFTSCDSCSRNKDKKHAIKESKLEKIRANINTTLYRYEKELFSLNKKDFANELLRIQPKFSFFLNGDVRDPKNQQQLYAFINDPVTQEIYKETMRVYPNVDDLKKQFDNAFSYYNYYFPSAKIPKVYTYVSSLDFELPIKLADSVLIIALDMYLGKECKYYKQIGIPVYKSDRFSRQYIVSDCLKEMAYKHIKFDNSRITLLDEMIMEGKRLYFAEAMMPDENDSIIIGYSNQQLTWVQQNEGNMWAYIIDKGLLYTVNSKVIMKFINDAPFTPFFANDSPGRAGAWIGWQIVRAYMNNYKEANIEQLLQDSNSQKILNRSKYKPKKR